MNFGSNSGLNFGTNDDRFNRISGNELLQLIKLAHGPTVTNKKSPLDHQKNKKQIEAKRSPEPPQVEQIKVGGQYQVTPDWDEFYQVYCKHFIPASQAVVHYLNQVVTVLQIQEDLVQVSFQANREHPSGWLPAVVLKSTQKLKLVYPTASKKPKAAAGGQELSQKLVHQHQRELEHKVEKLQQALDQAQRERKYYQRKAQELEKELKEEEAAHECEKESLLSQLQRREETLHTSLEEKKQMCERIVEFQTSWVPKEITYLNCLLEGCSTPDLFLAQAQIQERVQQVTKDTEKLYKKALSDIDLQKHRHDNEMMCTVCLIQPKSHMFEPCKHYCVCEQCAHKVQQRFPKKCPICRGGVVTSSRVYV